MGVMDKIFKIIVMFTLVGIMGMLVAIYVKIPNLPTFGDRRNAKDYQTRQNIDMKQPLVYVSGDVDVNGTVDIGNTPLEVDGTVDIGNTPLEVEIQR
jgi:hypothetical protein